VKKELYGLGLCVWVDVYLSRQTYLVHFDLHGSITHIGWRSGCRLFHLGLIGTQMAFFGHATLEYKK
jgi:hypothetical protein